MDGFFFPSRKTLLFCIELFAGICFHALGVWQVSQCLCCSRLYQTATDGKWNSISSNNCTIRRVHSETGVPAGELSSCICPWAAQSASGHFVGLRVGGSTFHFLEVKLRYNSDMLVWNHSLKLWMYFIHFFGVTEVSDDLTQLELVLWKHLLTWTWDPVLPPCGGAMTHSFHCSERDWGVNLPVCGQMVPPIIFFPESAEKH